MNRNTIDVIRDYLIESIKNSEEEVIKPNLAQLTLESLLFKYLNDERTEKTFALPFEILTRIDFTGISFDDFNCEGIDFSKLHNVTIKPSNVFKKSLKNAILIGVNIDGSLDDINIEGAIFEKGKEKIKK